jgi:hypothetical protein
MEKNSKSKNVANEKKSEIPVKVNVYIPDNVRNRQEKINQIYNILKPKTA